MTTFIVEDRAGNEFARVDADSAEAAAARYLADVDQGWPGWGLARGIWPRADGSYWFHSVHREGYSTIVFGEWYVLWDA